MPMPPARAYGLALLLLAAGGVGLLVAYGLTWVTVDAAESSDVSYIEVFHSSKFQDDSVGSIFEIFC